MVKQATLPSNQVPRFEDAKFALDSFDLPKKVLASALPDQVEESINAARGYIPKCIYLKFEDLKCFEAVERQYEHWGVIFANSLAIQASNPAFPCHSGLTVLMGSPKNGFLEATFLSPVNKVSALVTSSQQLVLSAYDRDRQLLSQSALPAANLANSNSTLPPNILLSVAANDIKSVTFCAFDGQFTLDDFRFCF
ncbi:hypothetical protein [Cylindrospermum sp. FACHB-282]|uniref:hypothetical protein n=1 Tax=Cylindrospermum sp. FACHB-282 TaxID=2692794 RepID=UPI001687F7A0|nr:hypothetical protein [Cylindrospermum sp. FACHB-282]MBD2384927.1 hypothetical protein [Cylindrospermum sp. FACHB-282]